VFRERPEIESLTLAEVLEYTSKSLLPAKHRGEVIRRANELAALTPL
jgi:hypothetical protein